MISHFIEVKLKVSAGCAILLRESEVVGRFAKPLKSLSKSEDLTMPERLKSINTKESEGQQLGK